MKTELERGEELGREKRKNRKERMCERKEAEDWIERTLSKRERERGREKEKQKRRQKVCLRDTGLDLSEDGDDGEKERESEKVCEIEIVKEIVRVRERKRFHFLVLDHQKKGRIGCCN